MTSQGDDEKRIGTLGSDSSERKNPVTGRDESKSTRCHVGAHRLDRDSDQFRDLNNRQHHAARSDQAEIAMVMHREFQASAADMQRVVDLLSKPD